MKVLFSNPPWWSQSSAIANNAATACFSGVRAGSRWPHTSSAHSTPGNFIFGEYMPYPFFMGYASTYAAKATGAEVTFRDSIALRESYTDYFQHLQTARYDYLFIETATPCWEHDRAIIQRIKEMLPDTRIVLTGALSAKGETVMADVPIHAVLQGEYEKGAVRVLNGASGVLPHDLLSVEEMNAAPYPYFDETIAHRYWDMNPVGQKTPQLQAWTSRGCPYKCIFCVWPATMTGNDPDGTGKRSVRFYSPDYVEDMLRTLIGRYGYQSIYFDDDTFNLADKHVLGICEVMTRIGLPWSAMCRADTIKCDTWKAMRDAGCFGVKLGFESGNQWVNDNIVNKHLNLETAREVVHELKRLGMTVHGTFTYGLPGETREQMMDTKRYIASLPLDTFQETGCGEIEGTPLATLREKGHLDRYKGAALDAQYLYVPDGGEKIRRFTDEADLSIGADRAKPTSDYLSSQWTRFGEAAVIAAGTEPIALWGAGSDFFEILKKAPALTILIKARRVRVFDCKLAGQELEMLPIEDPSSLAEFIGTIFLTPRMWSTRSAMRQDAIHYGIPAAYLRDVYTE